MPDPRPEDGESFITDEMRKWIGVECPPIIYQVTKDWIRKWCEAIGDFNPLFYDDDYARQHRWGGAVAPPTFLAALNPKETERHAFKLPWSFSGRAGPGQAGHALDAFEFYRPVRPGDIIISTQGVVDFYEKIGRNGRMLFTVWEVIMRNQDGQLVAKMRTAFVGYGKPVPAAATRAAQV